MVRPTIQDCIANPTKKNEYWDKCVRKSSLSIGLGGLFGSICSIFCGPISVAVSMSFCAAWAVKNCRALFREEAAQLKANAEDSTKKEDSQSQPCVPPPASCPPVKTFPPVLPIPDRPFGRDVDTTDKEAVKITTDCECNIKQTEKGQQIECTCPEKEDENYSCCDPPFDFHLECPEQSKPPDEEVGGCGQQMQTDTNQQEEEVCTCSTPVPSECAYLPRRST